MEEYLIDGILSRGHCIQTEIVNTFIKDLRILGRNLKDVAIVDNCVIGFCFQLDNGIPIYPYEGDENDNSLYDIAEFLIANKEALDIRVN